MRDTDRQKLALYLRHELGWSLRRVGRKLGLSVSGVGKLLTRATEQESLRMDRSEQASLRRRIYPISLSIVHNH
jgi:DNA-directed RNA polymerase specialized sigma24 family protein